MNINEKIKNAVDIAQRAQRNYDLSKKILDHDLETLVYAATNSPSKQNETHFSLRVYTDQNVIRNVYNHTKRFALHQKNELDNVFSEKNGKFWQNEDRSVYNSQILANALFVYVDDEGPAICGTHLLAQKNTESICSPEYENQKNFSIGISIGQLILSAALLGYKTGICSAFNPNGVKEVLNVDRDVKLLVGIGFENIGIDRQEHAETLNKDVPESFRNGDLNKKWKFPSFEKNIKVSINEI